MSSRFIIKREYTVYMMIVAVATLILSVMLYSLSSSSRIINKFGPLVDATMEIKQELTTAHLWFEEVISGDRFENIENVIDHIDQAQWYATAMLEGGENAEGKFFALSNNAFREALEACSKNIQQFKQITFERYNTADFSGIGTDIDQKYDRLFNRIIDQVDHVETVLQHNIKNDYARYQYIQIILILTVSILSILILRIQYQYDKKQKIYIDKLAKTTNIAVKNEAWLKTIMNSMGDGVIITDHNANVSYLNPIASSLTGWFLHDAQGKEISEVFNIVNQDTQQSAINPVKTVINQKVAAGLANHTELVAKDGTVWPISDSAAPIFDKKNNLIGVVLVFHEISARIAADNEKARMEQQLQQAYKMEVIGTMAGGIAHDFNNILAIILGNADMALEELPPEHPVTKKIIQILESSTRAAELVKQILTFSRHEESKSVALDFCILIEDTMKSLRSTLPSSVKLDVILPKQCDNKAAGYLVIETDPTQMYQVLLNLCVNAVHAMNEKGLLQVKVDHVDFTAKVPNKCAGLVSGFYAYLSIKDSGCGMTEEVMQHVFEPFFTTKSVGKGTGMGLSVVHGIVEKHAGKIYAESDVGQGTTFHIYIPLVNTKVVEKELEGNNQLPQGKGRILFVDDEEMLVDLGKVLLERLGYSVTTMVNSSKALALFERDPDYYDLVITDQTMPMLTGSDFAQKLLKIRPKLPIILCTGYSNIIDEKKSKEIGIFAFTTKPYNKKEMALLVKNALMSA